MRIPRFTVRRLMVAVAITGLMLGTLIERRNRFSRIAAYHKAEFARLVKGIPYFAVDQSYDPIWRRLEWHEPMRLKYEEAARYPWLPVQPDSPEPE